MVGTLLPNSLQPYGTRTNDTLRHHAFIPFDTTGTVVHSELLVPRLRWKKTAGTVVHLESRVPTEWEKTHLPIILLLTSKDWNPSEWEKRHLPIILLTSEDWKE
jgi:hypothetical protein